nr:MAG TPA: hypothetical protein [Caudoviricetes sp.]
MLFTYQNCTLYSEKKSPPLSTKNVKTLLNSRVFAFLYPFIFV